MEARTFLEKTYTVSQTLSAFLSNFLQDDFFWIVRTYQESDLFFNMASSLRFFLEVLRHQSKIYPNRHYFGC